MKRGLTYGFILIAVYLGVANATGAGDLIKATGGASSTLVKTFQGR